ncbi:MAG: phosphatase PAP2 family protein [Alphaproteobacteria bacterium]|nr:phosphatase PAP2 family protein [Alphaproteobacteria bacterium]
MLQLLEHPLIFITNLGDSGLLTALSFFCSVYLYLTGNIRVAGILVGATFLCLATMTVLKIYFFGCPSLSPTIHIKSPSGHAAMGAAIYGTLAFIVAKRFSGFWRGLTLASALVLILLIALSRIHLHTHTSNEVLLGLFIGGNIALLSAHFLRSVTQVTFRIRYLALAACVALLFLYGIRTPAEPLIQKIAVLLYQRAYEWTQ